MRIDQSTLDMLHSGEKLKPKKNIQPRQKPGVMNGTEEKYADILFQRKLVGEVLRYLFEKIKFKLAPSTFYTPDFFVVTPKHIEIHEVKGGYIRDDALVKFKVAAELFPEFCWQMWQFKNKKTGWKMIIEK